MLGMPIFRRFLATFFICFGFFLGLALVAESAEAQMSEKIEELEAKAKLAEAKQKAVDAEKGLLESQKALEELKKDPEPAEVDPEEEELARRTAAARALSLARAKAWEPFWITMRQPVVPITFTSWTSSLTLAYEGRGEPSMTSGSW
ncbi:MAG: hypothetical protein IH899_14385 [Planctomycetes bacterium]|nr:hypothetical protein [Planctomycetota bacterium]